MLTKTKRVPDTRLYCRCCDRVTSHRYIGAQHMPSETLHLWNCECEATSSGPHPEGKGIFRWIQKRLFGGNHD